MIEGVIRDAVWQTLLDAERFVRYYGARADHHRRLHRNVRFTLLFAAAVGGVSGIAVLVPAPFSYLSGLAGLVLIALVVWDSMADDGKKAAMLHAIAIECGEHALRVNSLWMTVNLPDDGDESAVLEELERIREGMLRTTARAGYVDVAEDDGENERAAKAAYEDVLGRFMPRETINV